MKGQERLEPCFCGSGRPRTECCEGYKGRVFNFTDIKLNREIREIREDLYEFLLSEPGMLEEGFAESVFSDYMDYSDLVEDQDYLELFLDWLAFSFKYEMNKTPYSLFLERKKESLRPDLYSELLRWKKGFLSAYRVKRILFGGGMVLEDVFSGKVSWLSCPEVQDAIDPGDVMIARLLKAGNWNVTFLDTLVFPGIVEEPLVQDISAMREKLTEWGFSYKSWHSFLRHHEEIILTILCACFEDNTQGEKERQEFKQEKGLGAEIREFLKQPRRDLGEHSPRELSFSQEGREKLELFFSRLERGDYDRKGIAFSGISREIKDLLGTGRKKGKEFSWDQEEYFEEACLLARRMARCHFPGDIETAISLWEAYSLKRNPLIRKSGTWSAAIDYFFSKIIGYPESQKNVAAIYGVSTASINSKMEPLENFIVEEFKKAALNPTFPQDGGKLKDLLELFRSFSQQNNKN